MIRVPLEILSIIWIAATIASGLASYVSFKNENKSMGFALTGFALGAFLMVTFYAMLLFSPYRGNLLITVPWSRWANAINGLMIAAGAVAAFIANRIHENGNDN